MRPSDQISDADYTRLDFMHQTTKGRLRALADIVDLAGPGARDWSDQEMRAFWAEIDANRQQHGLVDGTFVGLSGFIHSPDISKHLVARTDHTAAGPTELTQLGVDAFRDLAKLLWDQPSSRAEV